MTRPYLRQLEARHIPHVLVGGGSFHDREEVMALRTALAAIEWPDDELSVFATLRGPLFAAGDEALLAFTQQLVGENIVRRRLDYTRGYDRHTLDPASQPVVDGLEILKELHLGRNRRPIADTINRLLSAVRAHAGIALWQNGEQALANCQRLVDQARSFENHASSFRAFIEQLEADADRGEVDDAPIIEEGTEGVRAMTVHKAKGLDFPVVILVDPVCKSVRQTADRHVDPVRSLWLERLCGAAPIELQEAAEVELERDRAEGVRVAYVAATRARDLLVVPACGDEPIEGWLDVLNPVTYPAIGARRNSSNATGCPVFGEDTTRSRGPKGKVPSMGPVRPGAHDTVPDGLPVVWWDPAMLSLNVEELAALRHESLLGTPASPDSETANSHGYTSWKSNRVDLIEQASHQAHKIETVTGRARGPLPGVIDLAVVAVEKVDGSLETHIGGRRFGTLVHAALAAVAFDADLAAVEKIVGLHGRLVAASDEERAAAVIAVKQTLAHPVMRRAANAEAKRVHREVPVMMARDGILLEGVVDLAFFETTATFTGWTVVDFKTTLEFRGSVPNVHVRQVALYCNALSTAMATSAVRGLLLLV